MFPGTECVTCCPLTGAIAVPPQLPPLPAVWGLKMFSSLLHQAEHVCVLAGDWHVLLSCWSVQTEFAATANECAVLLLRCSVSRHEHFSLYIVEKHVLFIKWAKSICVKTPCLTQYTKLSLRLIPYVHGQTCMHGPSRPYLFPCPGNWLQCMPHTQQLYYGDKIINEPLQC
jgi:hypothetical protein